MPQKFHAQAFHIDHIIAKQHVLDSDLENLALACYHCNGKKGPNLSGWDPITKAVVPLFHPRRDKWADHFAWNNGLIVGLTPAGRVTVHVLNMNVWSAVRLRRALIARKHFFFD